MTTASAPVTRATIAADLLRAAKAVNDPHDGPDDFRVIAD